MDVLVIDSGFGGIPLLEVLKEKNKENNYIYIGDTLNFPYGNKTKEEVIGFVVRIIEKFDNITEVFLACNTASMYLENELKEYNLKGVIKPVKSYIEEKKYKNVCLFATEATISSRCYEKNMNVAFFSKALPKLIEKIEKNEKYYDELIDAIGLIPNNSQALVLGCTHFLLIKDDFKKLLDIDIICVDELI